MQDAPASLLPGSSQYPCNQRLQHARYWQGSANHPFSPCKALTTIFFILCGPSAAPHPDRITTELHGDESRLTSERMLLQNDHIKRPTKIPKWSRIPPKMASKIPQNPETYCAIPYLAMPGRITLTRKSRVSGEPLICRHL